MNKPFKLKSSWEELKEKLKETHIELTDSDLEMSAGNEDDFLDRIARKLNKTPGEVRDLVESISANNSIAG
jgi:uncharacterized protein YjbJ (UPF0337 family)